MCVCVWGEECLLVLGRELTGLVFVYLNLCP